MFKICDFSFTEDEIKELKSVLSPSGHFISNNKELSDVELSNDDDPPIEKKIKIEKYRTVDLFNSFTPAMTKISDLLNYHSFDVIDINENLFVDGFPQVTIDQYRQPSKDGIPSYKKVYEQKIKKLNFEYHTYFNNVTPNISNTPNTNNEILEPVFNRHYDNINSIEVCTFIYYPTCTFEKGGELVLCLQDKQITIDPRVTKCICISGEIEHYMTNCIGAGQRESIIFQVPTKKFNEHSIQLIESIESKRQAVLDEYMKVTQHKYI